MKAISSLLFGMLILIASSYAAAMTEGGLTPPGQTTTVVNGPQNPVPMGTLGSGGTVVPISPTTPIPIGTVGPNGSVVPVSPTTPIPIGTVGANGSVVPVSPTTPIPVSVNVTTTNPLPVTVSGTSANPLTTQPLATAVLMHGELRNNQQFAFETDSCSSLRIDARNLDFVSALRIEILGASDSLLHDQVTELVMTLPKESDTDTTSGSGQVLTLPAPITVVKTSGGSLYLLNVYCR